MKNWIYALASVLPFPLNKGAKWIADRIWGVFHDGIRFARWLKDGFYALARDAKFFLEYLRLFLGETLATVKWVIVTRIPQLANKAFNDAVKWAQGRIDWVYNTLKGVVATLEKWVKATYNTLKSWAENAIDWLVKQVNALISNVGKLMDRVFNLWSTPARLATWLIAELWKVFLQYVYQQRDKIASWMLNSSAAFTMWLARQLESIIVRLL
jgi:hypothetical protein